MGHGLAWTALRLLKAAPPAGIPRLEEVDLGFPPLAFTLGLTVVTGIGLAAAPAVVLGRANAVRAYYTVLTEKLASLPGIVSVGGATALPASPLGPDFERPVWAETDDADSDAKPQADVRMVTKDYFRTLGIAVLRGRSFTAADSPSSPRVVIVNEKLARQIWPGDEPVGKRLVIDYSTAGTYPYEVVGVVNDVRFRGLRSEPRAELYLAHAQRPYLFMNVAVRTAGEAGLLRRCRARSASHGGSPAAGCQYHAARRARLEDSIVDAEPPSGT